MVESGLGLPLVYAHHFLPIITGLFVRRLPRSLMVYYSVE